MPRSRCSGIFNTLRSTVSPKSAGHHGFGDSGSTLFLVPTVVLVAVLFAMVTIDAAAISLYQTRTDHIAQDAALSGAREISQSNFYLTGTLSVNPASAASAVSTYIVSLGTWNSYRISAYSTSTNDSQVSVYLSADVQLPIGLPTWLFGRSFQVTAHAIAQELSVTGQGPP